MLLKACEAFTLKFRISSNSPDFIAENSLSPTVAFIFSGSLAEIKVGKNLGLMYHQAGDAGHVKISPPIQESGGEAVYL